MNQPKDSAMLEPGTQRRFKPLAPKRVAHPVRFTGTTKTVNVALRCPRCNGAAYADHDGGYACVSCARPIAVPVA